MRIAQITLALFVLVVAVLGCAELFNFNEQLGGLPHMSAAQTWRYPNFLLSLMLLLICLGVGGVGFALQPPRRRVLIALVVFSILAAVGVWSLHRAITEIQSHGTMRAAWW